MFSVIISFLSFWGSHVYRVRDLHVPSQSLSLFQDPFWGNFHRWYLSSWVEGLKLHGPEGLGLTTLHSMQSPKDSESTESETQGPSGLRPLSHFDCQISRKDHLGTHKRKLWDLGDRGDLCLSRCHAGLDFLSPLLPSTPPPPPQLQTK